MYVYIIILCSIHVFGAQLHTYTYLCISLADMTWQWKLACNTYSSWCVYVYTCTHKFRHMIIMTALMMHVHECAYWA